jgi:hypothetical protein
MENGVSYGICPLFIPVNDFNRKAGLRRGDALRMHAHVPHLTEVGKLSWFVALKWGYYL